jgi:hypothetical protein
VAWFSPGYEYWVDIKKPPSLAVFVKFGLVSPIVLLLREPSASPPPWVGIAKVKIKEGKCEAHVSVCTGRNRFKSKFTITRLFKIWQALSPLTLPHSLSPSIVNAPPLRRYCKGSE